MNYSLWRRPGETAMQLHYRLEATTKGIAGIHHRVFFAKHKGRIAGATVLPLIKTGMLS